MEVVSIVKMILFTVLVVFDCHRISYTGKADEKNYRTAYGWNDIIFLFI